MQSIKASRFLVIGRAGMDLYADPPGTRIEDAQYFTTALGGSSANIAAGLARQGAQVALLTPVSDDAVGRFARAQLRAYGIDDRYVTEVGGEARNSLAVVETRGDGTQSVIYRNGAADFELTEAMVDRVDFGAFDAIVTTGTALAAGPSRNAVFHAFETARRNGLAVVFDIDYRPYSWPSASEAELTYSRAAEMADVIVGNDVEFGFLAGDQEKGLAAARSLARSASRVVVYKMGEKGSVTITDDDEIEAGVYQTEALKPTGAGDSFMAGFLAAIARGTPLREAVSRGSAAAAIVVARVGCAPAMPTTEELDAFLDRTTTPS